MTDLDELLPFWYELRNQGTEYVLATIVAVEGSGYRKPGARMLIAADGRRSGTISGGCLEAEVARKAFWHTEKGPVVRRYSTVLEDGDAPFGMGCGGVVHLLLERSATAASLLERLASDFDERRPLAIATILEGEWIGERAYWPIKPDARPNSPLTDRLTELAHQSVDRQRSALESIHAEDGQVVAAWSEWRAARPGLFIFGAGDDAIPMGRLARQLGWYVAVADGRSNLATLARFPEAHATHVLTAREFPDFRLQSTDAAVVMTHSLEQDARILAKLLTEDLAYVGVLGPRRRTAELLLTAAGAMKVPLADVDPQIEAWMNRLHSPMGLDLGGETPSTIALSVVSEIQQCLQQASGRPLRDVRSRQVVRNDQPALRR
jgi:xanthine/CO dehydrogenase XdhC/CoxF family maturation factor